MATVIKNIIPSHDEQFLKFLQKTIGSTSVPLFGALISITSLLFITILILMYSTVLFISNDCPNSKIGNIQNMKLKKPLII